MKRKKLRDRFVFGLPSHQVHTHIQRGEIYKKKKKNPKENTHNKKKKKLTLFFLATVLLPPPLHKSCHAHLLPSLLLKLNHLQPSQTFPNRLLPLSAIVEQPLHPKKTLNTRPIPPPPKKKKNSFSFFSSLDHPHC